MPTLATLIFLLIIIPPLPRVILTYLHSSIMPGIVSFILTITKILLSWIGESANVNGEFIQLGQNWINLEYPCIGLGVFTFIAIIIFSTKSNYINKVVYLLIYAFIYLIMNSLRLAILILYINKTYSEIGLNKHILHNNVTYFMYLVAFIGFLGFIFWFQDIDLNKKFHFKNVNNNRL